ncbi:MAG: RNA methyltransferase [Lentisphaeraceae bacterium]|nr:RNA methyltransferase [Lentisphaeraceae bacterium]
MIISSLQNVKIKNVVKLRNRRDRDKQQLMLIEGYRSLLRASNNHITVSEFYFCPDYFMGENEHSLIALYESRGAKSIEVSKDVFRKMSYRDRPEGLLGVAPYFSTELQDVKLNENPFLGVAQAIEKPGNLGTIIRSTDGTGADGLILCDRCTDLFNPNVITASTGISFALPIVETSTQECLEFLKEKGITILSATPSADTLYTDVDMTGPVAIIVGTEQYGLSDEWLKESTLNVRIPMMGQADSLNVSTATTLLLYEARRQRSLKERDNG